MASKRQATSRIAYVDTSCVVSILFGERGGAAIGRQLRGFDEIISSNLLEAELRAALVREDVDSDAELPEAISWVIPARPLRMEIARVLQAGYLRGADCWHVATALYVADDPADLTFLTLDLKQRDIARRLGFLV